MKYTTKLNLGGKRKKTGNKTPKQSAKSKLSRREIASRNGSGRGGRLPTKGGTAASRSAALKKKRMSKATRKKIRNVALVLLGIIVLSGLLGGLWFFSYLQQLNDELPPLDSPFGDKELASVVYDKTGDVELAKLIGDVARDPVSIDEIPEFVKWSFLAAEDSDFYIHQGFDPAGILNCGLKYVLTSGSQLCGGSTITQQVVKITVLSSEVAIERKLKELLMSIKIEQSYTKDEILQLYLTVAPFGGNIYGITTAADHYFEKEVKDLTLAEAAALAAIIQDPVGLSPTKGLPDLETARERLKGRQTYVLGQLRSKKDKINNQTRINKDDLELDDVITDEMIDEALEQEMEYKGKALSSYAAGHFVDFVRAKLTTENYKYGEEPFTETELLTGGYKIYTTLDYDIQQAAEQAVKDAMKTYGTPYKASNAAMVLTQPKTGHVIALVGSKDYYGESEGCNKQGLECRFDPQVNIITSRQSPGSSTKPFGFYEAYRQGLIFEGSFLPDIPIDVGGGYEIKNYNGEYVGVTPKTFAGQMLADSRNLPAILVAEMIGVDKFLEVMRKFGYSTYPANGDFGHSVILGGADVIPIEHAQAYGVFANGGDLVEYELITKIEDREGNVIFESNSKKKRVADEKAVYLLNQSIKNNNSISWDGRDVSAKSGTSEDSTDVWMAVYSPDFVAIGWMGNNNNENMDFNAYGVTIVQPWLKNFLRQIGETEYLNSKTNFKRPAGVSRGGGCSGAEDFNCSGGYTGIASGWMIDEFDYAVDNTWSTYRVCKSHSRKLARPIDEYFNNARDKSYPTYSLPYAPQWQSYLDDFMSSPKSEYGYEGLPNSGPDEYCNQDYSGEGVDGVWINTLNYSGGETVSNSLNIQGSAFTFDTDATATNVTVVWDSETLGTIPISGTNGTFDGTVTIPATYDNGTYRLSLTARDSNGSTYTETRQLVLNSSTTSNMILSVDAPAVVGTPPNDYRLAVLPYSGGITLDYSGYTGGLAISNVQICIRTDGGAANCAAASNAGSGIYTRAWNVTANGTANTYTIYSTATIGTSGSLRSATIQVSEIDP